MKPLWSGVVLVVAAVQLGLAWDGIPVLFGLSVVAGYGALLLKRWMPAGLAVLTMLVLGFAGGYFACREAVPGRSDPTQVLLDSVPRLLTAARPAPSTPELLTPGLLLVFGTSVVVSVAVSRKSSLFAPALGASVLYVAGALLTAGRTDRYGLVALLLVLLLAVGWLIADRRGPIAPPVGFVLALLALVAIVLPRGDAFEPRKLIRPPVTDVAVANPLPQLASWAALGDTELFRTRGPEVPMRLMTLSDYSGATWEASSTYGPLGVVSAPDLPLGSRTLDALVDVQIGALAGEWVPGVGKPSSVSLSDAMVEPNSGSLVLAEGVRTGLRYTVRGVLDTPQDESLATATVPSGPEVRRYLALPHLPFSLADYARQIVVNARTPYEKAVAIEQVVRLNRRPDADAPVGSSYARLETFLFGAPGSAGAQAGTAEQFASSFAVLARSVGLPTRVVVGFQPVPASPTGDRIVRAADATAWPEVYFTNWGWVPFDPVSGNGSGPSAASKREVLNRLASTTAQPPPPSASLPPLALPSVAPAPVPSPVVSSGFQPLWLLTVLLVPLLLWGLRFARRMRLRLAGPPGAWAYVLDALLLAGRSPAASRTAPDVARGLGPAGGRLAVLADRAAFSPDAPAAPEAWSLARTAARQVRRTVPWYRKLLWSLDPRPLWRR
ncbi:hypothetical protein Lesp02_11400 [Lentzea sp. NBRC 105346]|uniref:DUF3488 and transglutaminase-like domain-containing protein n=1 Tax=Lentzea sp. NBRC 105346 TaxID=3032205 RepID=UPI00249FDACA|nr:transglutaminase domain-containing protein [Lentzea sp. NBRC 105346]GLZ28950.1 hypothetical protein Lesp02_11400 [Lentzea sp. NBRC 105346]